MSFPKLLAVIATVLFGFVIVAALFKGCKSSSQTKGTRLTGPIEVEIEQEVRVVPRPVASVASPAVRKNAKSQSKSIAQNPKSIAVSQPIPEKKPEPDLTKDLPDANRIDELFNVEGTKLPIVETINYKSRVDWQKGRPAWLADYARYYKTSRHFIARSLNGKPDYFKQDLAENAQFNVYRLDKNFQFYLLVDLSRCRMWFYYDDLDTKERVLLKTYQVGIGRVDGSKASGFLTPIGKYTLGNKVAIYKPKMMGRHNGEQIEMVNVFGTRWIPFDKEVSNCSAPAKGLGIHGLPLVATATGERIQDKNSLGKYLSDGCVRLATDDVEELFAIIITRPTVIEVVKDFQDVNKR